jgi:transcription-repair coupling factor (superfamily II helicase)
MVTDFVSEYSKLLVGYPEDISVSVKNLEENYDEITIIAKNESIVRGSELSSFENIEFVYQEGIVKGMRSEGLKIIVKQLLNGTMTK